MPSFLPTFNCLRLAVLSLAVMLSHSVTVNAEVKLPAVFSDHMVLQRGIDNPIWGWAEPNEAITVEFAGQSVSTTAASDGRWRTALAALPAGGPFELSVAAGSNTITVRDVLVGEVWVCSGQSNMAWPVKQARDGDLETASANHPQIRLLSIPQTGSQTPLEDFRGEWQSCSPETVADFSAVGYFFGRRLRQVLGVPIGLIDNAWGGSACEAWIPQKVLNQDPRYAPLMEHWRELEQTYDHQAALAEYAARKQRWDEENAEQSGRRNGPPFREPRNPLLGQHRPGNLYHGVLNPIIGYGIRGVIWYQGENNANRAYQYRHLFPLMVQQWRAAWDQGTFPFYWVQLADFRQETANPRPSNWAELREAQTMALSELPNSGEAVIIDAGEADDIHPTDKQTVATRLVRWALARDYGYDIAYESPRYESHHKDGNKVVLRFNGQRDPNAALQSREGAPLQGFAIAGEDQKFVWAEARITGRNRVEVWSDAVTEPTAVRYAWADNPVCNLESRAGLPVTPFRTDDWPGITQNSHSPE